MSRRLRLERARPIQGSPLQAHLDRANSATHDSRVYPNAVAWTGGDRYGAPHQIAFAGDLAGYLMTAVRVVA